MSRVKLANSILKRSLKALGIGAGGGLLGGGIGGGLGFARELPGLMQTARGVRALPELVDVSNKANFEKLVSMSNQARGLGKTLGVADDAAYLTKLDDLVNSGKARELGNQLLGHSKDLASGRVAEDIYNLGAAGGLAGLGVGGYGLLKSLRKPKIVIPTGGIQ